MMFELVESLAVSVQQRLAVGMASVPGDHPMLADHFPGAIHLPGSWSVELAAQIAGPLIEDCLGPGDERWALLAMVGAATFPAPCPVPVRLRITAQLDRLEAAHAVVHTQVRRTDDDVVTMRGRLVFTLRHARPEWDRAVAARRQRVSRWKQRPP